MFVKNGCSLYSRYCWRVSLRPTSYGSPRLCTQFSARGGHWPSPRYATAGCCLKGLVHTCIWRNIDRWLSICSVSGAVELSSYRSEVVRPGAHYYIMFAKRRWRMKIEDTSQVVGNNDLVRYCAIYLVHLAFWVRRPWLAILFQVTLLWLYMALLFIVGLHWELYIAQKLREIGL